MQNDHLEDALLWLRLMQETFVAHQRFNEFALVRAIEEIEAEVAARAALTGDTHDD